MRKKKLEMLLARKSESNTYEQAVQGLFTAGTSVFPDLRKAGE
jgi:hypothetical protein